MKNKCKRLRCDPADLACSSDHQRWTSRDRAGEEGGQNLSCFVLNDPDDLVDLDGRAPDRPGPVRPPPDEVKKCCKEQEIAEGLKQLNNLFSGAKDIINRMGITPAPYEKPGASCISSSHEILAHFFSSERFPKCWTCRVEGRRGVLGVGQHAAIVCRSYSSDSSASSHSVLFDWWGDASNGTANSGGTPNPFYSKYPNNSGVQAGTLWDPPYYTACDGHLYQNEKGVPKPPRPPDWNALLVHKK